MKTHHSRGLCGLPRFTTSDWLLHRRAFLRNLGLISGAAFLGRPSRSAEAAAAPYVHPIPVHKGFDPAWIASLFARGKPAEFAGADLDPIGMPIGGICAGQLYLGGDGTLWHWDIFNLPVATNDAHYAAPMKPASPLAQGFAVHWAQNGSTGVRPLNSSGFQDVTFRGEYPVGRVTYRDAAVPLEIQLEAFSPFVPLDAANSSLPVTLLEWTVLNRSAQSVECELGGWLENRIGLSIQQPGRLRRWNRLVPMENAFFLEASGEAMERPLQPDPRPDIVFEDFESPTYGNWTVTGTAFGDGPIEVERIPAYQGDVAAQGRRTVNSHNTRQAENVGAGDAHVGRLHSRPFTIERDFINFLIGGGAHSAKTCINLLISGEIVLSATGRNQNRMAPRSFDVRDWIGQTAELEIVDDAAGGWGNIGLDHIVFSDVPAEAPLPVSDRPDFGTMGLALLAPIEGAIGAALLQSPDVLPHLFSAGTDQPDARSAEGAAPLLGSVRRRFHLGPGGREVIRFAICWHFPNLKLDRLPGGRQYATRSSSARAVAEDIARRHEQLSQETRLWRDTWYDSTLPYWFLDRTFANTSILATSTCHWFKNGRFYGWEGVGCCAGTCTHVWHYAHAVARLFPELERSLREMADFGVAFDPATGIIDHRGEFQVGPAVDGQAGCILRAYREHQISPDNTFLERHWPRIKLAMDFLVRQDANGDGILEGAQHNTLDAAWYGQVAWLSSLYLAALRACEEMAREMGDPEYAQRLRKIFDAGQISLVQTLWNGEFFIQNPDPKFEHVVGSYSGCEIDQVFGQSWAFQVGLGRVLPERETHMALRSLWKYNFAPDVGPYRKLNPAGRWYAMPGEAGLLMLTHPKQAAPTFNDPSSWTAGYFNECMNGFEYQVAGHLLWENFGLEALAVTRAIHDRYHPSRRNPWNEIECGDHYARSMASYGVFLAACGFEYHGPKGHIGFAPRLTPENFKAAFTAAEGWGTYEQTSDARTFRAKLAVKWGRLTVKTIALAVGEGSISAVTVHREGTPAPAQWLRTSSRLLITLDESAILPSSAALAIQVDRT